MMRDDGICRLLLLPRWALGVDLCNIACGLASERLILFENWSNWGVCKCGTLVPRSCDDRAALALSELGLDIRPQASHCLEVLNL